MSNTHRTKARPDAPVVLELGADLSPALKAIETAYRFMQRRHPELPDVTLVIQRDARAWGHTTVSPVWSAAKGKNADRIEIMISGENLARGAAEVAATLIHEAAHARNLAAGVLDTDVNGRHNLAFKSSCEALGLTADKYASHPHIGYSNTSLTDEQAKAWRQVIDTIDRGLAKSAKAHRPVVNGPTGRPVPVKGGGAKGGGTLVGPRRRGDRNLAKATCGCGHSLRISRGAWEASQPTCQVCGQVFKLPEPTADGATSTPRAAEGQAK